MRGQRSEDGLSPSEKQKRCIVSPEKEEKKVLHIFSKMTYWADNIKFIKDILESKYKKIDDSIADVSSKRESEIYILIRTFEE